MKCLKDFFLSNGLDQGAASELANSVADSCPWLDFSEEISEAIGAELLGQLAEDVRWPGAVSVVELVGWYNKQVREKSCQDSGLDPYAELMRSLARFGREDAFGEGDYWVVSDSFSSTCVVIVWFRDRPVPNGVRDQLSKWKSLFPRFDKILVQDEEGALLMTV